MRLLRVGKVLGGGGVWRRMGEVRLGRGGAVTEQIAGRSARNPMVVKFGAFLRKTNGTERLIAGGRGGIGRREVDAWWADE